MLGGFVAHALFVIFQRSLLVVEQVNHVLVLRLYNLAGSLLGLDRAGGDRVAELRLGHTVLRDAFDIVDLDHGKNLVFRKLVLHLGQCRVESLDPGCEFGLQIVTPLASEFLTVLFGPHEVVVVF